MAIDARDALAPGEVSKAEAVEELDRRRALAEAMGGPERVGAHRARGRLTARERVALFVDEASFVELGRLAVSDRPEVGERAPADAAVTGRGNDRGAKGKPALTFGCEGGVSPGNRRVCPPSPILA